MTDDAKMQAEIRARHAQDERQRCANGPFYMQTDDMHADRATLLRLLDEAEAREDRLREALDRQCDNMAFVLNHHSLPDLWNDKFARELVEDRTTIQPKVKPLKDCETMTEVMDTLRKVEP
jgi:hypothetical protein